MEIFIALLQLQIVMLIACYFIQHKSISKILDILGSILDEQSKNVIKEKKQDAN